MTRDLIEEILKSIGLEKINIGNEEEIWHVEKTGDEGGQKRVVDNQLKVYSEK